MRRAAVAGNRRDMGGTPRVKDKPDPSHEDVELRDPEILVKLDPTVRDANLPRLIKEQATEA